MLLLLGCATSLDLGRATVLDPGETRWSGGASVVATSPKLAPETYATLPWAQLHAGVHHGVGREWELGGRVYGLGWPYVFSTFGVALDAKRQLRRGGGPADPDLALVASPGWYRVALGGTPSHVFGVDVPLLVGYDFGPHQVVLSPRAGGWWVVGESQAPLATASLGVGLGVVFDLGRVELTPEASWRWAPVGFNGEAVSAAQVGLGGFETGIGLSW